MISEHELKDLRRGGVEVGEEEGKVDRVEKKNLISVGEIEYYEKWGGCARWGGGWKVGERREWGWMSEVSGWPIG